MSRAPVCFRGLCTVLHHLWNSDFVIFFQVVALYPPAPGPSTNMYSNVTGYEGTLEGGGKFSVMHHFSQITLSAILGIFLCTVKLFNHLVLQLYLCYSISSCFYTRTCFDTIVKKKFFVFVFWAVCSREATLDYRNAHIVYSWDFAADINLIPSLLFILSENIGKKRVKSTH